MGLDESVTMSLIDGVLGFDLTQTFFHGTRTKFTKLQASSSGEFGPGVYLTSFEPTARFYAHHVARGDAEPHVVEVLVSARKPFIVKKVDWVRMTERSTPRTVQKRLMKKGFDCIIGISINDSEWQLVVFDETQVQLKES